MSVLLKKSVSALSKKDVGSEITKIEQMEQDIEWSIWQCTYTDPVMLDPCLHLYCSECINQWSKKTNECPKCKETIKGIDKQPEVERLITFYSKLCIQERAKLEKIKILVDEREEIQTRINSVLDQQTTVKHARPTTAQPKRRQEDDVNGNLKYKTPEVNKEEEVEDNSYYCKICERRPFHMKLKDYTLSEMSPFSLNGNEYQQKWLTNFLTKTNLTLDNIYKQILSLLPSYDAKQIFPDSSTSKLRENNSACNEWLFEFSESCLFHYCVVNRYLIDGSGNKDCGAGAYWQSQYDESHAKAYNHFIAKGGP